MRSWWVIGGVQRPRWKLDHVDFLRQEEVVVNADFLSTAGMIFGTVVPAPGVHTFDLSL